MPQRTEFKVFVKSGYFFRDGFFDQTGRFYKRGYRLTHQLLNKLLNSQCLYLGKFWELLVGESRPGSQCSYAAAPVVDSNTEDQTKRVVYRHDSERHFAVAFWALGTWARWPRFLSKYGPGLAFSRVIALPET